MGDGVRVRVRPLIATLLTVAALLIAAGVYLYSPDKNRSVLEARYAPPPSQFITVQGIRLHVRDTGPKTAPTLLMLHGFGSSLQTWDAWSDALSPRFRMVRFDLPSFGLTGGDPSGDYSDGRTFQIMLALMDQLGIARATLVGNSMGGGLAWRFAAAHPDRTDRLVLISPEGFPTPGEQSTRPGAGPPKIPFTLNLMRFVLPTPLLRMNIAPSYADPDKLTAQVMARYRDMLLVQGNRDAILARMMQMPQANPGRRDPVPTLRTIQAPTLILWGEHDRLIPFANAADYVAALPHATLVALPTLGHVPQEEAPEISLPPLETFLKGR